MASQVLACDRIPVQASARQRVAARHEHHLRHTGHITLGKLCIGRSPIELEGQLGAARLYIARHLGRCTVEQRQLQRRKLLGQFAQQPGNRRVWQRLIE